MPIRFTVRSKVLPQMLEIIARDSPNCDGMGHVEGAAGADAVYPVCDGMGVLFKATDAEDALAILSLLSAPVSQNPVQ